MHEEIPSVYRLPVHLQNQQMVYFDDDADPQTVADRAATKDTQLLGWFKANQTYPEAHQYTYQDMPPHFTWNKKSHKWTPRQRGDTIGRMNFVHPSAGKYFYPHIMVH
jgi:hypothetical protein